MRRYMPPARRERRKLVVQRLVEQVARQWRRLRVRHQRLGFDRFLLVNSQSLLPSVAAGFVAVRNRHDFRGTGVGEHVRNRRTEGVRTEWLKSCLPRTLSANKVSRAPVCKLGERVPEQACKQAQCARQAIGKLARHHLAAGYTRSEEASSTARFGCRAAISTATRRPMQTAVLVPMAVRHMALRHTHEPHQ